MFAAACGFVTLISCDTGRDVDTWHGEKISTKTASTTATKPGTPWHWRGDTTTTPPNTTAAKTGPPATASSPATRSAPATPATYTLGSGGALCGKEKLETALAYRAVQNGDKAGALGLVARGEVDYLEPGTTVHAFSVDGEFSGVSVTSGTNLGKQCWVPTKMLGSSN